MAEPDLRNHWSSYVDPNRPDTWPPSSDVFHRRGHHVQKAHGRRTTMASDGSHLNGGMIALMPTAADAKRLALPGGERAADLHLTLYFLGDDGSAWTEDQRDELEMLVRARAEGLGPVTARIFGVAHWNGSGDSASWVWNTGDDPEHEGTCLEDVLHEVTDALESTHDRPEIPPQHSPWAAHICAAYDKDLTLVRALEKRLGPVTFDRLRLSFGDDDRDIPLTGEGLTASALRRDVLEHEAGCDFADHNRQWEGAVSTTTSRLYTEMADWRSQIKQQIVSGMDTPEELAGMTVTTTDAADILQQAMDDLAQRAGTALQREAERQGVTVPEWGLPEDAVTAAVGGRRMLRSVAQLTADLMATSVLQTAKRIVTGMVTRSSTPDQIAAEVDRTLVEGQESTVRGPVGTAMSTAQTAGRQAVLEAAPPGEYYASEILDRNTCAPCKAVDGEQFGDLEIAIKAYPVMGYKDCVGPRYGNSCRGMIVARWSPEETEPVTAAGEAEPFHGSPGDPGYASLHPGRGDKGDLVTEGNSVDKGDPLTYYRLDVPDAGDPDQAEADEDLFANYSSDGYSDPVSNYLRTGESDPDEVYDDSELEEMRDAMDRIAERHTLAEPVSVYRIAPASVYDGEDGDRVVDGAFMSTTVFKEVTEKYRTSDDDVIIRIDMPKGAHVIPHRHMNPNGSAKGEVIIPRDLPLQQRRREDGVIVYEPVMTDRDAEEVESDDTSSALDDEAQTASAATMRADEKISPDGGTSTVTTEALRKGKPSEGTDKDKRLKENKYGDGMEDCPPGMVPDQQTGKCVEAEGTEMSATAPQVLEVQGPAPEDIGGENTAPWRGPLTVEGIETGDGREFDNESLTWADLPLPLRWNKEDSHGGEPHTVAVNVGRIDKIWREDSGLIMGEGLLDLSDDDGRRVHAKIEGKFLRGVSVDVDSVKDADMELVWPEQPDGDSEGDDLFAQLFASPEKVVFHKGRIRAATLVDIPAFAEAYIALLGEDGAVVAGGEPIGALRASFSVLTRSAAVQSPSRPPADWFANPDLSVPTGITVSADGRVYGHAALWGTCHIGQAGVCVTPPQEDSHPYFMTGSVLTETGAMASVGQITVGTNHADLGLGHRAASDHYDNTGWAVADVTVGNDAHGIWVAGAVRPGADPLRVHELRGAGQVSGDWRSIGGKLRLVGLLAVNVPGFPVPKLRTRYTSGSQFALVAAGMPQLSDYLTEDELDQWAYSRIMAKLNARVHPGR